nr:MFS transporter [Micromonospora sp. DSM 115978]
MPNRYLIWLAGVTLSLLGTQVMGFAMAWVASGHSGTLAGAVLTAIVLPRVLLLLVGGWLTDRFGAWRVMTVADATMVVVTGGLALGTWWLGPRPALLLSVAVAIGVVDACYLPGSGSMPRRLVPAGLLARALSARQVAGQVGILAGPPVGGLLVAAAGLAAAALANAVTFAAMLLVLVMLRPRASGWPDQRRGSTTARAATGPAGSPVTGPAGSPVGPSDPPPAGPNVRPVRDPGRWSAGSAGLRLVAGDPPLRAALLLTAAVAGFLLPVPSLLVPLLARDRDWSAPFAGVLLGAVALGTTAVALAVTARGALPRAERVAAVGLLIAAAGVGALAVPGPRAATVAAGVLVGVGSGLFATHIGPLLLGRAPDSHLARVQAVVILVQNVPLLATNPVLGHLAGATTAATALTLCATVLAGAAFAGLRTPALRTPALHTPALRTPALRTPAPVVQAPGTPAPATPRSRPPAPEASAPGTSAR